MSAVGKVLFGVLVVAVIVLAILVVLAIIAGNVIGVPV